MKKQILLSVLMLLPLVANAAIEYDGLWYNLNSNNNTAEVVESQGTQYSGEISIPSRIYHDKEYYVTSIGTCAFEGCINMTSVSIPSCVTTIGSGAFWSCTGLKSIVIPEGVTTIAETAFNLCSNLTAVVIPNSVTSIGSRAFANCSNLIQVISQIKNPFSINSNVFTTYSNISLVVPQGTKSAYQAKSGWKSFTNINDGTYDNPKTLTLHVAAAGTLPYMISEDQMYQIEKLTLSGELNGTDIFFIRKMAGIYHSAKNGAYYYFTDGILKSLDISNAKIVQGGDAYMATDDSFDSAPWTDPGEEEKFYTDENSISALMFYGTKLESIVLPNTVTSIGCGAFSCCSNLKSITIPKSVTTISQYWDYDFSRYLNIYGLFYGCVSLATIEVENGNSVYDSRDGCNAIIMTNDNTLIAGCKNTKIPKSVKNIGNSAFRCCINLTSITIPNSVTSIGSFAFYGCSNSLNSIKVESENPNFDSRNNCNAIIDSNNQLILGCKNTIIPNSVTSIGNDAFYGCSGLTSMNIPNNVTSIGDYAFSGCSGLVYITLPNNLNSIGNYAFSGCNSLVDIYCKAENVPSTSISSSNWRNPFSNQENITLYVPNNSLGAYQSTEPWNRFKQYRILSNNDAQDQGKCSKPTISIIEGSAVLSCETSGVDYRWNISTPNGTNGSYSSFSLSPITLKVYATKSGYQNSDVATYELFPGLAGDVNGDGKVNVADHVKLTEIIMSEGE